MNSFEGKSLKKTQKKFKNLFNENKDKAMYVARQVLNESGFYSSDDSLINIKIEENRLFILSFCPDLSFTVPKKFMFDNIRKSRMSTPTLFSLSNQLLDITSYMIKYINGSDGLESLEIPFKLVSYELKKHVTFGKYKEYHNFFLTDKAIGEDNISDELENVIIKSIFKKYQLTSIGVNQSNIFDFRKKIFTSWAKSEIEAKNFFFKNKDSIFDVRISSLIRIAEDNSAIRKSA